MAGALDRLQQALRPGTHRNYRAMFKVFLGYLCFLRCSTAKVSASVLLSFLEFLTQNYVTVSAVRNYISAIKTEFSLFGLDIKMFEDPRIAYYQRALIINRPFVAKVTPVIDVKMLENITLLCDTTYMGQIFKAVYLTAFFSFARMSNLVSHVARDFDPSRQLCRGDVIFRKPGVHLIIKWSKTLQTRDAIKIIKLPSLGSSSICPVRAIRNLLAMVPGSNNSALFQVKVGSLWMPLTDSKIRKHFSALLTRMGCQGKGLTFHSFRHLGASLAFNSNVDLQQIKNHGTWASDCVWTYLIQDQQVAGSVASSFQKLLQKP